MMLQYWGRFPFSVLLN